jgi:LPS O-antigen subunit length determinant protein (WzzB/FepE family)
MPKNTESQLNRYYEVNLLDIFSILNTYKYLILFSTIAGILISIYSALIVNKIYVSEAKLTASSGFQSAQNNQPELGGLLSVISAGSSAGTKNKTSEAVAFLRSRTFFKILYQNDDFLGDLFAANLYNSSTNEISYDQTIYNSNDRTWKEKITFEDAYLAFHQGIFSIKQDTKTGIYKLELRSISPYIASKWLNLIIESINDFIKLREVNQSEKKIAFYELKIAEQQILSLRNLFLSNLQYELQLIAYSKATDEFAFSIIDYPHLPERPSEPSRTIIVMLGSIISLLISILFSIAYHYLYANKNKRI